MKVTREPSTINLADFAVACDVLGPGRRAVVWAQGCPRRCPNCITPQMQSFSVERKKISPRALAFDILACMPVEGITFVGGEPFSQARSLVETVVAVREAAAISVVTYTGYKLEQLAESTNADWLALLSVTDLLIDGEYVDSENCDLLWRGSANQRLHFLTPRYRDIAASVTSARERHLALEVDSAGNLRVIGIPAPGFFDRIAELMRGEGVDLTWSEPS